MPNRSWMAGGGAKQILDGGRRCQTDRAAVPNKSGGGTLLLILVSLLLVRLLLLLPIRLRIRLRILIHIRLVIFLAVVLLSKTCICQSQR